MAAIDLHVGTQASSDRDSVLTCDIDGEPVGDGHQLGAARACLPSLSSTHNGLTRMVWVRRTLEDLMVGRTLRVIDGRTLEAQLGVSFANQPSNRSRLYFSLDPAFQQNEIPWMPAAVEQLRATALIGESGKMKCPTWDLPAGSPMISGSCPGAVAGQSVIPPEIRRAAERGVGQPVKLQETICQICYAEGGQYASPHVQLGEVLRFWWCRSMLDGGNAESRSTWIATMVRAIAGEIFPEERMIDPRTGKPVVPMRIHSSGDFYSAAYAEAWVEVCNQLPEITFWAPTRSWAAPGWMRTWKQLVPRIKHGNLVLRPSAYHTNDPAPGPETGYPWDGDYTMTAAGTTALYKFDDANAGRPPMEKLLQIGEKPSVDPRYDWGCQTYQILDDAHSCRNAIAPDGQVGCRACWLYPQLRVNYTAH